MGVLFFYGLKKKDAVKLKWGDVFSKGWRLKKVINFRTGDDFIICDQLKEPLKNYRKHKQEKVGDLSHNDNMFPKYGNERTVSDHLKKFLHTSFDIIRDSGKVEYRHHCKESLKLDKDSALKKVAKQFRVTPEHSDRFLRGKSPWGGKSKSTPRGLPIGFDEKSNDDFEKETPDYLRDQIEKEPAE
ncbi:hypothetical protein Dalk_2609 [Desulfatibacillum aliphaticivorans]|uniref:Uncharacterized protein n=1 Tax=Desulfatibacillum aliphaticivorans TaxID=218208 RepID=B8FIR1_DESAL|nr:hypothetical protein Dalk_2609 [Desulfatibacillum aliphaticivorans]